MAYLKYIFALIFTASSLASVWIFANRGNLVELEWQSASLGDMYGLPPTGPRMNGFSYKNKRLTIKTENIDACGGWKISGPDGPDITLKEPHPTIPLSEGQHEYVITPINCEGTPTTNNLVFDVLMIPMNKVNEDMASEAISQDVIRLISMPLIFSLRPGQDFSRWTPPAEDFGKQDIQRARDFLAEHGITDNMSSLEKVARISHALSKTLPSGTPPERLNFLSPAGVLNELLSGRAKAFCRQRALTQVFLSNVAGIPSRMVWTGRVIDGVMLSSHALVESYITEQSRWAFSDISHWISYITDRDGFVLNAADVLSLISTHTEQGVTAWSSKTPMLTPLPSAEVSKLLEPWFNKNVTLTYWSGHDRAMQQIELPFFKRLGYRVQRYLFEPTLFFGYQHSYNLHWLRGGLILTSLISGLLLLPLMRQRKG